MSRSAQLCKLKAFKNNFIILKNEKLYRILTRLKNLFEWIIRYDFNNFLKLSTFFSSRMFNGRQFHNFGPAQEKALSPYAVTLLFSITVRSKWTHASCNHAAIKLQPSCTQSATLQVRCIIDACTLHARLMQRLCTVHGRCMHRPSTAHALCMQRWCI